MIRDEVDEFGDKIYTDVRDVAWLHLRFNNGDTLDKNDIRKKLEGRLSVLVINQILNTFADDVVKVKDIDTKTEIEYLDVLYSSENFEIYFQMNEALNELKRGLHEMNMNLLHNSTMSE